MILPKRENWTLATTERVLARIDKLFEEYERVSVVDDNGVEQSKRAIELDNEILTLRDAVPFEHRPKYF